MTDMEELRERLRNHRPVPWEQMPDFALYMDQVLNYMDRQVIRFSGDDTLTSAMVNNYTKGGLVPRAAGKKYGREHLAYLTAICILKRVMSTRDMDLLIRQELRGRHDVKGGYAAFCDSLDKALNITLGEVERREGIEDEPSGERASLADNAIHFALLSYAAGVASRRYVALLRKECAGADGAVQQGRAAKRDAKESEKAARRDAKESEKAAKREAKEASRREARETETASRREARETEAASKREAREAETASRRETRKEGKRE